MPSLESQYQTLLGSLKTIAQRYYFAGRLNDAIDLLRQGIEIASHDDVSASLHADLLLDYGEMLVHQAALAGGDYELALAIAQETRKAATNPIQQARALDLTGSIHYWQVLNDTERDFSRPREYFHQALETLEGEDDMKALFGPVLRMGLTHQFSNELDEAMDYFRRAESLARDNGLELELSYAIRHVGFVLQMREKLDEALAAQLESLELRKKLDFKVFLAMAYVAVASLHNQMGKVEDALEHYEQALTVAREVGLLRPLMVVLLNYGMLLQDSGQIDHARSMLEEAQIHAGAIGHTQGKQIIKERLAQMENA